MQACRLSSAQPSTSLPPSKSKKKIIAVAAIILVILIADRREDFASACSARTAAEGLTARPGPWAPLDAEE